MVDISEPSSNALIEDGGTNEFFDLVELLDDADECLDAAVVFFCSGGGSGAKYLCSIFWSLVKTFYIQFEDCCNLALLSRVHFFH